MVAGVVPRARLGFDFTIRQSDPRSRIRSRPDRPKHLTPAATVPPTCTTRFYGSRFGGIDIFRAASEFLSRTNRRRVGGAPLLFNAQMQPKVVWPASPSVAARYLDSSIVESAGAGGAGAEERDDQTEGASRTRVARSARLSRSASERGRVASGKTPTYEGPRDR